MHTRTVWLHAIMAFVSGMAAVAFAQSGGGMDLSWSAVVGGGAISTGGGFEVGGAISHPAAQPAPVMSGGGYSLMGGLWPVTQVCYCLGDMNGDGKKDGGDVQRFVDCIISSGACSCADVDAANGVTIADVGTFVGDLLAGAGCP